MPLQPVTENLLTFDRQSTTVQIVPPLAARAVYGLGPMGSQKYLMSSSHLIVRKHTVLHLRLQPRLTFMTFASDVNVLNRSER